MDVGDPGAEASPASLAHRLAVDAQPEPGLHVAIIMDGNGRWARRRGLPRRDGHRAGAAAVTRTVTAAPEYGIRTLTLYAFSSDNWKRPPSEVSHLMRLFHAHLRSEAERCVENGVRVNVIGRRDRLPATLLSEIESLEARTSEGDALHLLLAVDYSSRNAIVEAASYPEPTDASPTRDSFRRRVARALNAPGGIPDVDLLIRTGGEQRLSDFLLWEAAYAELVFIPCLWPDFTASQLGLAMRDYSRRDRRYGGLSRGNDLVIDDGGRKGA
jgi:undecaprenyl diphosphate synthase